MYDMVSPNTTPADPFPFLEQETGLLRSTAADRLTHPPVLRAVATEVWTLPFDGAGSQLSRWGAHGTACFFSGAPAPVRQGEQAGWGRTGSLESAVSFSGWNFPKRPAERQFRPESSF